MIPARSHCARAEKLGKTARVMGELFGFHVSICAEEILRTSVGPCGWMRCPLRVLQCSGDGRVRLPICCPNQGAVKDALTTKIRYLLSVE